MIDQNLLEEIQYVVIEPPDGGQSWPSGLWSRDEILAYLNQRQDRIVRNTHMIIGVAQINVTAPYGVRHSLPVDWIATIRATWTSPIFIPNVLPPFARRLPLARSDAWEADHGIPSWPYTNATPKLYMDGDDVPLTIRIAPIPNADGIIELYYVPSCSPCNGNGTSLTIADEFAPTLKYGILADMFSKVGRAQDAKRAEYCEKRFQMGVQIAQTLLKGFK